MDSQQWIHWNNSTPTHVLNVHMIHQHIQEIMNGYDMIVLVERFDECIVLMQLLLNLSPHDMLYLPSKTSSANSNSNSSNANGAGEYWNPPGSKKCHHIQKSFVSPAVDDYLKSDEWYAKQYGDYLLLEVVNQSLDKTIDEVIGRPKFQHALNEFLQLKARANQQCGGTAIFPCGIDQSGKVVPQIELSKQNCYQNDWGCGYPCLDTVQ